MPLIASNIRPVNSSALLVAIIQDVGRSSATTRTRRAVSSAFSFSQSPVVRRDRRSTCSTSKKSPGCASLSSRNSSGRDSLAPLSFSTYQAATDAGYARGSPLGREGSKLASCAVGVLIIGRGPQVCSDEHADPSESDLDGLHYESVL